MRFTLLKSSFIFLLWYSTAKIKKYKYEAGHYQHFWFVGSSNILIIQFITRCGFKKASEFHKVLESKHVISILKAKKTILHDKFLLMVLQPSTTLYFLMKQFFVITVLKSIVPFCNTFVKAGVKWMWSLTLQCIMHRNDACWFCSNVQNPCPILKIPFKSLLASNDPLSWVWPKNMLTDFWKYLFTF